MPELLKGNHLSNTKWEQEKLKKKKKDQVSAMPTMLWHHVRNTEVEHQD